MVDNRPENVDLSISSFGDKGRNGNGPDSDHRSRSLSGPFRRDDGHVSR